MKASYRILFTRFATAAAIFISIPSMLAANSNMTSGLNITQADSKAISMRPAGFLQQQFTHHSEADDPIAFSIYRARFGFAGPITDRISMNVVLGAVEPPDSRPHLVNAFVDFTIDPRLNIRTGQFLVPFGLEGPEVITFNPAIERSLAIRRLNTVNMFRDIGIQVSGSMDIFNYAVAVINGSGANNTAQIDPKDFLGRVGITPIENLEFGVSGHIGRYDFFGNDFRRYRLGTDVSYQFSPFLVRGELIFREDDLPGDNSLSRSGGYLLGTYNFTDNWQTLLRFEYYDANTSGDDDFMTAWTAGVNYYIAGQSRISANYELRDDRLNAGLGNLFTVQLQISL